MDRIRRRHFLAALAASAAACRTGPSEAPSLPKPEFPVPRLPDAADLVVRGGSILTQDDAAPTVEALAAVDGVLVAAGRSADIDPLIGDRTTVVDLEGGLATPGLVDAHAHLVGLGQYLSSVDLRGAASIEEVVSRVRENAPKSGWIIGRGWDQNLWPDKSMPTHHPLTQAFPDRVVWLRRVDGHAAWGNAALLREAGITTKTKNPAGGELLRDGGGTPTGVLVDAAMGLVAVPPPTAAQIGEFIRAAQRHVAERGLTGIHEMGIGQVEDSVYRQLATRPPDDDGLAIRVHAYASQSWFDRDLQDAAPDPIRDEANYTLAGVKLYADGALGSRGAALLSPYADRAEHSGLILLEPDEMLRLTRAAMRGGWQVATHAIGDAANRAVLDAYEGALPDAARPSPRPRIEHCQILSPSDIPRFAELGVIASMQPTHATSDMAWVPDRIGDSRLAGAYAWRALLDSGATLCFGSDFPVELADVTHGLVAAITRQNAEGQPTGGWLPDQKLGLDEAIWAFSSAAARAAHRESHLGRLAVGMRADVTCFARDIRALPPAELRNAKVSATIVEGRVAYRR